ncbi:MAG: amylo-alpha-1,6-glucosidase [Thermoplasmata archaeon]
MKGDDASAPSTSTGASGSDRERAPVLLSGMSSTILLSKTGEVSLRRETRGAMMEWGGVYAQCVRLTGAWPVSVVSEDATYPLGPVPTSYEVTPWKYVSEHAVGPLAIRQELVPVERPPGALRSLQLQSNSGRSRPIRVECEIEPFLMPVLVEGIRPIRFLLETQHTGLVASQHGFGFRFDADPLPSHLSVNRVSWIGGRHAGEIGRIGLDWDLVVDANFPTTLRWFIWGGLHRTVTETPHAGVQFLSHGSDPSVALRAEWTDWRSHIPVVRFPDAPKLETGYRHASDALRRLYTNPEPDLCGLVAGFPWYSAVWCRDLAWMLPALLWLGDLGWVERSLASVFRFQAAQSIPVLGAEPGELPMQISPGPLFLYGTSDTTLYYPEIVRRLLRHRGSLGERAKLDSVLLEIARWGYRRCDPTTGLVRNGGEAEEIALATRPFGKIHYGFDAVDTTIWDSTDRRDHAIDIQVLWYQALLALADLVPRSDGSGGDQYRHDADQIANQIRLLYRWESERYLYDSRNAKGPVAHLRPNALRAVSAGLFTGPDAQQYVRRAAEGDLTTAWGIRTLASGDAQYDPATYHDGQVWSIATAWGADAALTAGESDLGVRYLEILADRYIAEDGYANECYRGDRLEPFNSCFLLGFSVAPFLTTLFERLWGLEVDARLSSLSIHPRFPRHWKSASLARLRIGEGEADIDWTPGQAAIAWRGKLPLTVAGTGGTIRVDSGGHGRLSLIDEGAA